MKILRFRENGNVKPGVLLEGNIVIDVSAFGEDWNGAFFETDGMDRLAVWLNTNQVDCPKHDYESLKLDSAVPRPSKIICIGLNFKDHAEESDMDLPKEPVVFFKATSSLCGPNDNLVIPRGSEKTDWEVELGLVIGKKASYVPKEDALDYVAGYVLHNDYSERAYQLEHGGQWAKGKSCDTFAPLGPFVATPDELGDLNDLKMWLKLNGKIMQEGTTANFIFDVQHVVS